MRHRKLATVMVTMHGGAGPVTINVSDFDPRVHTIVEPTRESRAEAAAAAVPTVMPLFANIRTEDEWLGRDEAECFNTLTNYVPHLQSEQDRIAVLNVLDRIARVEQAHGNRSALMAALAVKRQEVEQVKLVVAGVTPFPSPAASRVRKSSA